MLVVCVSLLNLNFLFIHSFLPTRLVCDYLYAIIQEFTTLHSIQGFPLLIELHTIFLHI